jgi:hypothetical protein
VAGGCSSYKWSIGSVELRTGESVARMQALETRRQSGAVSYEGQNKTPLGRCGAKEEGWEEERAMGRKIIQHDHMTSEFQRTCE